MKKFLTVLLSSTFLLNTLNAEEMPVLENDNEVKEVVLSTYGKHTLRIANMRVILLSTLHLILSYFLLIHQHLRVHNIANLFLSSLI